MNSSRPISFENIKWLIPQSCSKANKQHMLILSLAYRLFMIKCRWRQEEGNVRFRQSSPACNRSLKGEETNGVYCERAIEQTPNNNNLLALFKLIHPKHTNLLRQCQRPGPGQAIEKGVS